MFAYGLVQMFVCHEVLFSCLVRIFACHMLWLRVGGGVDSGACVCFNSDACAKCFSRGICVTNASQHLIILCLSRSHFDVFFSL